MRTPLHVARALPAALALLTACGGTSHQSRSDSVGEGGADPAPCASSQECTAGEVCTTEDGVCNPPPGCHPGAVCPAVCYGNCRLDGERCGSTACAPGMVCCNASCGVCTLPDQACTQQACEPPAAAACETDSDCRAFSDYCTRCDCRALSVCEAEPACPTPGVQCLVDPCGAKEAYCAAGTCALRPAETCPPERCGPTLGMPNSICPDGETIAGPTDLCLREPDGTCGWEVISCPDPAC